MANKKKKKITIDIILPNYNSYEFIDETLKSISRKPEMKTLALM